MIKKALTKTRKPVGVRHHNLLMQLKRAIKFGTSSLTQFNYNKEMYKQIYLPFSQSEKTR